MSEWNEKDVRNYFLSIVDKALTQKDIAQSINVSEASISRFINGEIGPGEKMLDYLGLERVFRYRPTQSHLPHDGGIIPQNKMGTGGKRPLIDKPDEFY